MDILRKVEGIRRKYNHDAGELALKLPYQLCKEAGIDTEGMTPSQAWAAWEKQTGGSMTKAISGSTAAKKTKTAAEKKPKAEKPAKPKKEEAPKVPSVAEAHKKAAAKNVKYLMGLEEKAGGPILVQDKDGNQYESDHGEFINVKTGEVFDISDPKNHELIASLVAVDKKAIEKKKPDAPELAPEHPMTQEEEAANAKKEADKFKKQMDDMEKKKYSGIWYGKDADVSNYEYYESSGSIDAKKAYYNQKLSDPDTSEENAEKFKKLLGDLEQFEKEGKEYAELKAKYKEAKAKYKELAPEINPFEEGAYTKEKKDAAMWAKSPAEADAKLFEPTGEAWNTMTKAEKQEAVEYTGSYSKFNESLRHLGNPKNEGWYGADKIKPSVAEEINNLTSAIDKCSYDFDMWMNRGVDYHGMDLFFGVDMDLLKYGSEEDLQKALLGTTPIEYGFCSCGDAKGYGFSGNIKLNIYAPAGTKCLYVEPFSSFGSHHGVSWDGKKPCTSFGTEAEVILQQGTKFHVTKVERNHGTIWVDMEVIEQNPVEV